MDDLALYAREVAYVCRSNDAGGEQTRRSSIASDVSAAASDPCLAAGCSSLSTAETSAANFEASQPPVYAGRTEEVSSPIPEPRYMLSFPVIIAGPGAGRYRTVSSARNVDQSRENASLIRRHILSIVANSYKLGVLTAITAVSTSRSSSEQAISCTTQCQTHNLVQVHSGLTRFLELHGLHHLNAHRQAVMGHPDTSKTQQPPLLYLTFTFLNTRAIHPIPHSTLHGSRTPRIHALRYQSVLLTKLIWRAATILIFRTQSTL